MPLFETLREIQEIVKLQKTLTAPAIASLFEIKDQERLERIMKLAAETSTVVGMSTNRQTNTPYLFYKTRMHSHQGECLE
ncbi:hypothetical protein MmiEs2_05030 [Methanimicrococcus stummii]|uniref:Uncharacterized protein n=1 Tax=Methanimicrococcus stummii TaxID=3028294 RepID=A0AA96V8S5_9EURY|nr:hypothetical protein [Methanimicrococcus sp. Es2]WNY28318.1 hypothetical protein MmiEs2_05030 [Methanimicrococcus sp. Es2]